MKYQQQKIKQLQAESKSNEMKYLEEKEKTATLLQFIENNSLIKKELNHLFPIKFDHLNDHFNLK